MSSVYFSFVLLFGSACALIPSYIIPCKEGPKLEECTLKNGNRAIPYLIKGDPKHKIPVLDPLVIKELTVTENARKNIALNFTLTDLKIVGLKEAKFVSAVMDLKKKHLIWKFVFPKITFISKYKISGKFLILPVTGNGPSHLVLEKPMLSYTIDYKTFDVKGVKMAQITKTELKYTTERLRIKFDNLFNGDKTLGDNMNKLLNENWQDFNNQLGPSVAEGINIVLRRLLENIIKNVPYKDIINE